MFALQTEGLYCSFEEQSSLFCTDLVPNPGISWTVHQVPTTHPDVPAHSLRVVLQPSPTAHLNGFDERRQNGNFFKEGCVSFLSCPKQLPYTLTRLSLHSALPQFPKALSKPIHHQQLSGVIEQKYIHVVQLLEIQNTRNMNKMKPDYSSS